MNKYQKQYEQYIIDKTVYSGSMEPNRKKFSISSLGQDLLRNYYDFIYGKTIDKEFGHNTAGSLYQLGVDEVFKENQQYYSAIRMNYTLPNGWELSGEMDQIDTFNQVIIDNKLLGKASLDKIKKAIKQSKVHNYQLQLAGYRMLMKKNHNKDYRSALAVFNKSSNVMVKSTGKPMIWFEFDKPTIEEIEEMYIKRTDELQFHLDNNIIPPICTNIAWGKMKGRNIPITCTYFCGHNKICKYFNKEKSDVRNILDML